MCTHTQEHTHTCTQYVHTHAHTRTCPTLVWHVFYRLGCLPKLLTLYFSLYCSQVGWSLYLLGQTPIVCYNLILFTSIASNIASHVQQTIPFASQSLLSAPDEQNPSPLDSQRGDGWVKCAQRQMDVGNELAWPFLVCDNACPPRQTLRHSPVRTSSVLLRS